MVFPVSKSVLIKLVSQLQTASYLTDKYESGISGAVSSHLILSKKVTEHISQNYKLLF